MIFAPASPNSPLIALKKSPLPSPAWISLPSPEPSSVGRSSEMIRDDTTLADCATPPPQLPMPLPAAICATTVPCPTTSSMLRLFGGEDTWVKLRVTRPLSAGWLRFTPESTSPMVTPAPVRPAPSAPAALVRRRCSLYCGSTAALAQLGTLGGLGTTDASLATFGVKPSPDGVVGVVGGLDRTLLPPPPQAASDSAIAQGRSAAARRWRGVWGCWSCVMFVARLRFDAAMAARA